MKKVSSREQKIFMACVLLGTIYLFVQLFIRPVHSREEELEQRIDKKLLEIEKAKKILQSEKIVGQKYQQYVQIFGAQGPDEQEVSSFISDIETNARQHQIGVQNLQSQRTVKKDKVVRFFMQLTVEGKLSDIIAFFYVLQNKPYYIFLEEVVLERMSTSQENIRGRILLSKMRLIHD